MSSNSIGVYWWNEEPNFGDSMNPILLNRLYGVDVVWSDLEHADLTASGSVIQWITPVTHKRIEPIHVWGSGFIFGGEPPPAHGTAIFAAVRGHHSVVFANLPSSTVTGDPGLLASRVIARPNKPVHKIGVVPHLIHTKNPVLNDLIRESGAIVIDVKDDPLKVIKQIAGCEFIFSSSLHGLIIADSYDIPNARIALEPPLFGVDWKFNDYFSNFGIAPEAHAVTPGLDLGLMAESMQLTYNRPGIEKIRADLFDAFPFR